MPAQEKPRTIRPQVLGVELPTPPGLAQAVQTSERPRRSAPERVRLTPKLIEELAPAEGRRNRFVYDSQVRELAVRVTPAPHAGRAFVVYMWSRVHGRVSYTLGACDQMLLSEARHAAREAVAAISRGEDPVASRRAARAAARGADQVTLETCAADYLAARKDLKPRTRYDYGKLLELQLAPWRRKPMASISRDMVQKLHAELGRASPARANYAMRYLRMLFNFAEYRYEREGEAIALPNPVRGLRKAWFPIGERKTFIAPEQLAPWWAGLAALRSDTGRDFLELLVLSGLRKGEGLALEWKHVDMGRRAFRATATKNGRDHELPMSDALWRLFARRAELARGSPWVFPGQDPARHMVEPAKSVREVAEASGVKFSCHDLRRTFARIAELYVQPPLTRYLVKRLLNHSVRGDVTGGYIHVDVENLRPAMQAVTDFVLRAAQVTPMPVAPANDPSWQPPDSGKRQAGRANARPA